MTDFTTNIQEYLEAADRAHIAASLLPPTVSTPIPPSPLSSPHSAAPASVLPSLSPFVYPAAAVAAGLSPSWSCVGGYDHPQPGSRLMQYGTFLSMFLAIFVTMLVIRFITVFLNSIVDMFVIIFFDTFVAISVMLLSLSQVQEIPLFIPSFHNFYVLLCRVSMFVL